VYLCWTPINPIVNPNPVYSHLTRDNTLKAQNYKIFSDSVFVSNMSKSLQTLAAEAHLAEGQFSLEEQTLNIEKMLLLLIKNYKGASYL
jgi:hypothetical protein